jgi:hypothetical protein
VTHEHDLALSQREAAFQKHPRFVDLVKATAATEAPFKWGHRHTINCPAYDWGVCLGSHNNRRGYWGVCVRRAMRIAKEIAEDLGYTDPRLEVPAHAFVLARHYVRARALPPKVAA